MGAEKTVRRLPPAILGVFCAASAMAEEVDFGRTGSEAIAAWRCAALARESDTYSDEANRLFELGYPLMSRFVDGVRSGSIPEDQLPKVPLFISRNMVGGPNTDFELGVLWSAISDEISDNLSEHLPDFTVADYALAKEMRAISATEEFQRSSCTFLD